MKQITLLMCATLLLIVSGNAQNITLNHLASYQTGVEESAETVAYSPANNYAYFTNSATNTLSIVNVSTPNAPTLVTTVNLAAYGAGPNSVAVHGNMVAVAMEDAVKQNNGKVVFFDLNGTYVNAITAGALPDMLTFTPDGTKVLVANEGEPSKDYTNDPEGSVTVINVSTGAASATATTINFTAYNNKKASLINKGVRIFGNNGTATVAQDLEPEYITVTPDNKAYVNCQENNALIVINLSNNSILDILPLGYKNHNSGTPSIEQYTINELVANWPDLGTPIYNGGQPTVKLGGFSGLFFDQANSTATNLVFYAVPDRGPNASSVKKNNVTPQASQNVRPFKLPDYQGRIVKFTLNKTNGTVTLDNQILLTRQDGTTPITGKGNIPGFDEVPVTYSDIASPFPDVDYTNNNNGENYHELDYDAYGGDFEGVLIDKDGNFWLCDEYRPALYKFQPNGTLIERYVPNGTSALGTTIQPAGTYGAETLPAVYSKRRANRGFEAIAYDATTHKIYAFIQSPMYNPSSATKNNSDVIRILEIDATNGTPTAEFVYLLERNKDNGYATARVDKIGDAVYKGNGKFLVIERDSEAPSVEEGKKYIFEIDITYATNVLAQTYTKELEEMTADEIAAENILVAHKTKVLNLPTLGYNSSDKPEGLALLPNNEIAVLNDNDFGIAGAGSTDKSVLGLITFASNYKLDASNKDNAINIVNHPTLGMFMPDAIASYQANGKNYIVTANEGDARDYDGYSEETRVKSLTLNPAYYPNAATLQAEANLGRLKTTTATGDYNGDGIIEQIYSYGARSFSIFDAYGNLVFDSGDEFGQQTAIEEPSLFNEDDGDFDKRSDDKGVEPEAVAIGTIGNKTYAFIGLERQSSILVYDITNPKDVEFLTYYKGNRTTGDTAPEIIKFVPSTENQSNKNLLLVGYEISGSLGIIEVLDSTLSTISEEVAKNTFKLYPNPVIATTLTFNKNITGRIYTSNGKLVKRFKNKNTVNVANLKSGVYVIKTKNNGVKRFVKL